MSEPVPSAPVTGAPPALPAARQSDPGGELFKKLLPSLVDVWVVAAWFAVLGVLAALLWWQVTPLAAFTRTAQNGSMDEQQLSKEIAADGWFFVIAAAGGLVSGLALVLWRGRRPILMVLLILGGGFLATLLMTRCGLWFGPRDPAHVLNGLAVGQKAQLQLKTQSKGLLYVWPMAALAGALLGLWGGEYNESRKRHAAAMAEFRAGTVPGPASGSLPGSF
ncbi:MAG: hypothetical protein ACJ72E_04490 [Marmoricola sp.]